MRVEDGLCRVEAPALRPSLPPAIHTDRIERRAEAGWLRFDAAEQLAALERSLTPRLAGLARDPRHLAFAREPARLAVARFVRAWLLGREAWGAGGVRAIAVTFADEGWPGRPRCRRRCCSATEGRRAVRCGGQERVVVPSGGRDEIEPYTKRPGPGGGAPCSFSSCSLPCSPGARRRRRPGGDGAAHRVLRAAGRATARTAAR